MESRLRKAEAFTSSFPEKHHENYIQYREECDFILTKFTYKYIFQYSNDNKAYENIDNAINRCFKKVELNSIPNNYTPKSLHN